MIEKPDIETKKIRLMFYSHNGREVVLSPNDAYEVCTWTVGDIDDLEDSIEALQKSLAWLKEQKR